jgi:hypothetical protein
MIKEKRFLPSLLLLIQQMRAPPAVKKHAYIALAPPLFEKRKLRITREGCHS